MKGNFVNNIGRLFWLKLKETNAILTSLVIAILLITIDYFNVISSVQISFAITITGIVVLIAVWTMYVTNFYKLIKLSSINVLDMALVTSIMTMLVYMVYLIYVNQKNTWKFILAASILVVALIFLFIRLSYVKKSLGKHKSDRTVVDLRDLCEGKITKYPVVVGDQAVNYDLLDRDVIVSVLCDSINSAYSSGAYVIGLEGEWGTGKTTIANLAQQRLVKNGDICIVKGLDFWTTGSSAALIQTMYDSLLKALNINYNSVRMNKLLKRVAKFMVNIPQTGNTLNQIINENISQDDVDQLHDELKDLILTSGKKYVFFVDDLDRANKSQVLFLLKMLGTLFNLPNSIFVLLYDKNRMKQIVNNGEEVNPAFEEKIVNQEIRIPKVSEKVISKIYKKSLSEVAKANEINDDELSLLMPAIELVAKQIESLRELKRVINSICNIAFSKDNKLNPADSLLLEFIYFKAPGLYKLIKDNSSSFISQDFASAMQYLMENDNERSERLKKFYDENLEEYKRYIPILEEMFPYVKSYYAHDRLHPYPSITVDESKNDERQKQFRVCSGYYFDLYFSLTQNDYSRINLQVEDTVNKINAVSTEEALERIYRKFIDSPSEDLRLKIADLRLYIDQINDDKKIPLCRLLLNSANEFLDDGFPSPRTQVLFRCKELLETSDHKAVSEMLKQFCKRYELLQCMDTLNSFAERVEWLQKLTTKCWYEICKNILKNKVNLYEDGIYGDENAWGLYRYAEQQKLSPKCISNYLDSIVSDKNVYRILNDAVRKSRGTKGYGYRLENEYLNTMGLMHVSKLRTILQKTKPANASQERVYLAYQKYLEGDNEERYYDNPINPSEL